MGRCGVKEFESVPQWVLFGDVNSCLTRERFQRACGAMFKLDFYGVFEGHELT